jgi:hypothetical protein
MMDEAISNIRVLEDTLQELEKRKRELAFVRQAAPSVDLGAGSSSAPPSDSWKGADLSPVLPQCWAGSSSVPPPPHAAGQGTVLSPALPQGWGSLPIKRTKQQEPAACAPRPIGFRARSESNVALYVMGDDAFVTVFAAGRPGVLLTVLSVLEKHHIDVITVQIAPSLITMYTRVRISYPPRSNRPPCCSLVCCFRRHVLMRHPFIRLDIGSDGVHR